MSKLIIIKKLIMSIILVIIATYLSFCVNKENKNTKIKGEVIEIIAKPNIERYVIIHGDISKEIQNKIQELVINLSDKYLKEDENKDIYKNILMEITTIYYIHDLSNYYIIYLERRMDTWFESAYYIIDTTYSVCIKSGFGEEESLKDPLVIDINKDGANDVVIEGHDESYGSLFIYHQKGNTLIPALKSLCYNLWIDSPDSGFIRSQYLLKNIDRDNELELTFNYLRLHPYKELLKNVVYDLKNNEFIMN